MKKKFFLILCHYDTFSGSDFYVDSEYFISIEFNL